MKEILVWRDPEDHDKGLMEIIVVDLMKPGLIEAAAQMAKDGMKKKWKKCADGWLR